MNGKLATGLTLVVSGAILHLATGCAAFRASTTDVDVDEPRHMDAEFDYTDMRSITEGVVTDLLNSPFLVRQDSPPVMMISGVQNRTSEYVDTKSLTDRVRGMLFDSQKVHFVNEARRADLLKEQGYQSEHATPESQVAVGRQLGAKYMLSGSLAEMRQRSPRQVRVSRQELNYYKLTMEVTDLESGLLTWTTEKEFARQASKPLIGW